MQSCSDIFQHLSTFDIGHSTKQNCPCISRPCVRHGPGKCPGLGSSKRISHFDGPARKNATNNRWIEWSFQKTWSENYNHHLCESFTCSRVSNCSDFSLRWNDYRPYLSLMIYSKSRALMDLFGETWRFVQLLNQQRNKEPFVLGSFQLYAWLGSNMFHARFTKIFVYIHIIHVNDAFVCKIFICVYLWRKTHYPLNPCLWCPAKSELHQLTLEGDAP